MAPDRELEHARAELAFALPGGAKTSARGPILRGRGGVVDVGRTAVPVAVENVERPAVVIETIGADRQLRAIHR